MERSKFLIGTLVSAAILGPASAFACTCDLPGLNGFQIGRSGEIPANAGGVMWHASFASDDPADDIWVEQVEGETRTRVEFSVENPATHLYVIRPVNWAQGNTYRIHVETGEGDGNNGGSIHLLVVNRIQEVEVEVGPAFDTTLVPQLSKIGPHPSTLSLEEGSACSTEFEGVAVDLSMNIPALDANNFNYVTTVDGKVWAPRASLCTLVPPGESWVGRGRDRLVVACDDAEIDDDYKLLPGEHTVSMEARLPGTDIVYRTETITVDLKCPDPTEVEVDPDAGTEGTDAGTDDPTAECPNTDSGCQSAHGSGPLLPVLAFFGLLGFRKRRRSI